MPFLVLQPADFDPEEATVIPVAKETVVAEHEIFGDEAVAFDGSMLTRRRAQKKSWTMRTRWMTEAEAATYNIVWAGEQPFATAGDLMGVKTVVFTLLDEQTDTFASGIHRAFTFRLREE